MIRFSGLLFLATFCAALVFVLMISWGRAKQKPFERLGLIRYQHGLNIKPSSLPLLEQEKLFIETGEISLGAFELASFVQLTAEKDKIFIKKLNLKTFDETPWQWLFDFCGQGVQPNIEVEQCFIKNNEQEAFALGSFSIMKDSSGLVGQCKDFTVRQVSSSNFSVQGHLAPFLKFLKRSKELELMQFSFANQAKESSGVGEISLEVQKLDTFLFQTKEAFQMDGFWRERALTAQKEFPSLHLQLHMNDAELSLEMVYRSNGVNWEGRVSSRFENYQIVLGKEMALGTFLATSIYAKQYLLPADWLNRVGGIYECRRDLKTHRLQILSVSENKMLTLNENAP